MSFGKHSAEKRKSRIRRKERVRKSILGTSERPRLSVFRSAKHIYAQLIDDDNRVTLASASSKEKTFSAKAGGNKNAAANVGKTIAERAKQKNIQAVCFDRGGFVYHGRIKALADAAREAGLKF